VELPGKYELLNSWWMQVSCMINPPMTVREKVSGVFYIYITKWVGLNAEVACH